MHQFGAFEGKNNFGKLLDLAEAGEEVVITRHGRPVARLVPNRAVSAAQVERARAAGERIRQLARSRAAGTFNWDEWKSDRDQGRK
ncbi:MAG TPA: type II toxin-antitoxin system prevent-host-death family antitoxin [Terracidiphilus sp.]|jgi:prevent-host-death family protein|nr:type II toxin-antitoxin system prevent-host-death family antitoxin [Terracidiphilus sp.]